MGAERLECAEDCLQEPKYLFYFAPSTKGEGQLANN